MAAIDSSIVEKRPVRVGPRFSHGPQPVTTRMSQLATTKSKIALENLPTMAVTWARARANGAAGSSEWTEPTCKAVV